MKIKSVYFANIFEAEGTKTLQLMLDNDGKFRVLDALFSCFIVTLDYSYSENIFHVFSGSELRFKNIERFFYLNKKAVKKMNIIILVLERDNCGSTELV